MPNTAELYSSSMLKNAAYLKDSIFLVTAILGNVLFKSIPSVCHGQWDEIFQTQPEHWPARGGLII